MEAITVESGRLTEMGITIPEGGCRSLPFASREYSPVSRKSVPENKKPLTILLEFE